MDAARGDGVPPPDLLLAMNCERWNCLPDAGGYFDQQYDVMYRMNICSNVYNVVRRWYSLRGAQIHSLSEQERLILRWLRDIGVMLV